MSNESKKNILLCVAGMTPQIITETLYALTMDGERVDEIQVITTPEGRNRILETLLNKVNGKFYEFCKDFEIDAQNIKFDETTILLFNKADGTNLEDIRTSEENEIVRSQIFEIVRRICKDEGTNLHASVTGGRKTMSIYLTAAIQLYGRLNDRLSYVLVNSDLETSPDFFYPPPIPKIIKLRDGREISTSNAEIYLSTIPFTSLRDTESGFIKFSFIFPDEIKIHCEQYLLYFAQFLQDLGIKATSNLKEEAGKVLFSVTPTDDFEALDKIREALAIYLSLPSNPIPNSTGDRMVDMVLSGARANIKHLESQLELAIVKLQFKEATLELKDATIEQHQLTIRKKNETIRELQDIVARGNIFQESLEKVEINGEVIDEKNLYRFSREDDIEVEATPVLDEKAEETKVGLVKFHEVTKLKEYGVTFDLAKAIRDLIDYFRRDKDSR